MSTVVFIGHSSCPELNISQVKASIHRLAENGADRFLCGGMGEFDHICASAAHELKSEYNNIHCNIVLPNPRRRIDDPEYFDEIIYPDGWEDWHFKAAITKRNRWMVENADTALCYVVRESGGAAKTLAYAKKFGLKIVSVCP